MSYFFEKSHVGAIELYPCRISESESMSVSVQLSYDVHIANISCVDFLLSFSTDTSQFLCSTKSSLLCITPGSFTLIVAFSAHRFRISCS